MLVKIVDYTVRPFNSIASIDFYRKKAEMFWVKARYFQTQKKKSRAPSQEESIPSVSCIVCWIGGIFYRPRYSLVNPGNVPLMKS